ncbi:dihydropteroate synthase [Ancylomarina sp. 16SWW S1-10-2]|uniref:dihydropteroate synthase n=1 Tax=Ancylomarina sp. 16SWW S1-10-2 TaxID=2499681 RepID=UPI001E6152CB|nr:dihydropteroate synthase [Ancylomarina sp. 16SWW S1-10-2]
MQKYKTNSSNQKIESIMCAKNLISFDKPLVMGILNLTPDSFFDGGQYIDTDSILKRAKQIVDEGADMIDLGAYSTRPGAKNIDVEEEWRRMQPALACIRKEFPNAILSIDTFRSEIVRRTVNEFGLCIVNDISGGLLDDKMYATIAELQVPYIMMHMKGTPQNMQTHTDYKDLMKEIVQFFSNGVKQLNDLGAKDIIIDPGFGFAKTLDHNYEIMAKLSDFNSLKCPLLVGISRKSMIYKLVGGAAKDSLNGTTALNMTALMGGANILRVHDVKEAVECVKIYNKIQFQ